MLQRIRQVFQVVFLGVFLALMILGKAQIWMALIFISIALASLFGRFYCGWMCPINTLIRPTQWISKKLNCNKKQVPNLFKSKKLKYIAFALFLIGLSYTIYTITQGRKFPLPLIIIPIALIITFFINENTWHTYLCPWGTLLSFTSRFSKYRIQASQCLGCSLCKTSCPADAVIVDKNHGTFSSPTDCLLCFKCIEKCPSNIMKYKK